MTASHLARLIERVRATLRAGADRGASLVEYALLLALIAVVCVSAVSFLGESTSDRIDADARSLFHSP